MNRAATTDARPALADLPATLSDNRLAQRATEGDRRAFATIYRRYHQDLYRYCLAIVANGADAEDALQNTMVKVLGALPGERRRIRLKPWLYRIAHNESVELLRRRRPSEPLDPELAAAAAAGPAEEVELRERLRRLASDLSELPERQRGALVMRELAGLDFAEISAAFGTSPAVARQTVYEARLSLRQIEIGREMSCVTVTKALSDGDRRTLRRREIKAHLRSCEECQAFREEIDRRRGDLAALAPLPALAASGLLQGLLGSQAGSAGGSLASSVGGGAGKAIGASALAKTAAAVAVVASVGVIAGNRAGVIHFGASAPAQPPSSTKAVVPKPADGESSPAAAQETKPAARSAAPSHRQAIKRAHQPVLRAAEVVDKGAQSTPVAGGGSPSSAAAAAEGKSRSGAHSHGRARAKEPPAVATHGKETAAIKRGHGKSAPHIQGKGRSATTRAPNPRGAHSTPPGQEHIAHEPQGQGEPQSPKLGAAESAPEAKAKDPQGSGGQSQSLP